MILLTHSGGRAPAVIAVFGTGLLGAPIVSAVRAAAEYAAESVPLSWSDPALQGQQIEALEAKMSGGSVKILWSAGKAGFAATEEQTALELASFQAVLGMAERLARRVPTAFYLLSSAGGLFQGQRYVDPASTPEPRIPYGFLKQRQEQLLEASGAPMAKRIYRLSSVYGHVRPGQRLGLISTLILNGVRYQVTPITAWMSTLRDFIFADDVARFLGPLLLQAEEEPGHTTAVLAHGKPCSLLEIQRLVESVVGHRIYVRYSLDPSNRDDITFSHHVLPPGWQSSDMRSNISSIYKEAVSSGAAFGRSEARN